MTPEHPFDLTINTNRAVFDYIRNLSAHSDIVEPLVAAVKPLGDVQIFTPEKPGGYRYYAVSTKGIIFAFAIGTRTIAFRLDNRMWERAVATGAKDFSICGTDWVSFEPFRCDWPKIDFEFWALKAYVYAGETASS